MSAALRRRLDATRAAAVGGSIAPGPGLSAFDRAVYLHRYVHYMPPAPSHGPDPPGDNALYRRERLCGLGSLWRAGFWEPAIHRALRDRGEALAFAPTALVEFRGGCRVLSTLRRRLAHGRQYGAWRARERGLSGRLIRSAFAPAVPPVLLTRATQLAAPPALVHTRLSATRSAVASNTTTAWVSLLLLSLLSAICRLKSAARLTVVLPGTVPSGMVPAQSNGTTARAAIAGVGQSPICTPPTLSPVRDAGALRWVKKEYKYERRELTSSPEATTIDSELEKIALPFGIPFQPSGMVVAPPPLAAP